MSASLPSAPPSLLTATLVLADIHDCRWKNTALLQLGTLGPAAMVQYVDLWRRLRYTPLSATPDELRWRWTASGEYSAKSCYDALFLGATQAPHWRLKWKTWAPLRIKVFIWLALQNRCWTADRLARRGPPHADCCVLCDQETEGMQHILSGCSFSRQVWQEILSWCRTTADLSCPGLPFLDWWASSCDLAPASLRKGLSSLFLLTALWLWKHQNGCVFDGLRPSTTRLVQTIQEEAKHWARAGGRGLDQILPES